MFQKVVHSSILLLLVSVKLSVNGLVSEGDVAGKSELLVNRPPAINVTVAPVLSEHGHQDIDDAVKKTSASSDELRVQAATKDKANPLQDKPLTNQTNSTLSYNSTASLDDEKKADEVNPPQSAVKNATVTSTTNSTISATPKPTLKIGDDAGTPEDPAAAEGEETTSPPEPTTETAKTLPTDPSSSSSSSSSTESTVSTASSESVSESSTTKSSTASTTETAITAETVTATLPEESSSAGKTTQEPKVEPTAAKNPGMSSGIIALVMAIVFAVVVIIVYVGLLLWRRYLEFRYGNRELLVNDLEFDTNDLRHFEL